MYIIHLGCSGFPRGNATIKRILLTFRALGLAGLSPLIINKLSINEDKAPGRVFKLQNVPVVYTSPYINRPNNIVGRFFNKVLGYLGEMILLFRKRKQIHSAIYYDSSFLDLLYYRLISFILGFRLVIHYVEYRSAIPERNTFFKRINDSLFDRYSARFCHGAIVISEFLKRHIQSVNPSLPVFKMPVICDFDEFLPKSPPVSGGYMMYCGGIAYLEVIHFIVDLYNELKNSGSYQGQLLLAIGGGENEQERFRALVKWIADSSWANEIRLYKDVPYKELVQYYLQSELLIIPYRNTIQDIAGFHHKVGEYTASAKPIISTRLGEMANYFEDDASAILADEYSVASYMGRLSRILLDKETLNQIARKGYETGFTHLNYKSYSTTLKNFITSLK